MQVAVPYGAAVTERVDFVVNCYERTYRRLLAPGVLTGLVLQQRFSFASTTLLINNVDDRADAARMASQAIERGDVDRAEFVSDHLPAALSVTGLLPRNLARLPHFTDCCLVAVTLPGPEWLVYWDADATLLKPLDWVSPLIDFISQHPKVAIGNPNNWHDGLAEREALEIIGEVAVGFGFSDVAFLARRSDLARPIYRKVAPASWRYPLAHVEPIFEQRVDAWMRRGARMRATYLPAVVTHPEAVGINYPDAGLRERFRGRLQRDLASFGGNSRRTQRSAHGQATRCSSYKRSTARFSRSAHDVWSPDQQTPLRLGWSVGPGLTWVSGRGCANVIPRHGV